MSHRIESPVVLLIGPESGRAWDEIAAELPDVAAVTAADPSAALSWLSAAQREPAVIFIGQAWPGERATAAIREIEERAPLARICMLGGSWCEGELCSGKPWPGALRVYRHQWPGRAARELRNIVDGRTGAWVLPSTASDEERLLAEIGAERSPDRSIGDGQGARKVCVLADQAEAEAALVDACRSLGFEAAALGYDISASTVDVDALLWDTTADAASDRGAIDKLGSRVDSAPIVALLGFPREDEVRCVKTAGVAAVVSKPYLLADLAWQITAVLRRSAV